jgi:hypothetical protein
MKEIVYTRKKNLYQLKVLLTGPKLAGQGVPILRNAKTIAWNHEKRNTNGSHAKCNFFNGSSQLKETGYEVY